MNGKKFLAVFTAVSLAAMSLAGCGQLDGSEVVATVNGTDISLGLVNLKAQIMAASYDTYMAGYYGADMWDQEVGSTEGETMADNLRHSALEDIELQYLLEEHASEYDVTLSDAELAVIDSSTAEFLADNDADAIEILGAEETYVKEMFRLMAIEEKMGDAIRDTADTEVSEEELAEAQEENENATEASIISERQNELYNEVTDGYKDSAEITVNEKALKKISFKKFLQIKQEDIEDEEESVDDTEETEYEMTEDTEYEEPEEEEVEETESVAETEE